MTRGSRSTRSQSPPTEPPVTPNGPPEAPIANMSNQQLCDVVSSIRSAGLSLIQDTQWPPKSKDAAQQLVDAINSVPTTPGDVSSIKGTVGEEVIRSFESVNTRLKEASEKYEMRKQGMKGKIKHRLPSLGPSKCSSILHTCREEIEDISATLSNIHLSDEAELDSPSAENVDQGSKAASGTQQQPSTTLATAGYLLNQPESPSSRTKTAGQIVSSGQLTSHRVSVDDTSSDFPQEEEVHSQSPNSLLAAVKMVCQGGGHVLEAFPVVGGFLGLANRLALSLVDMIETMDRNDYVAKELTSHARKLAGYLERLQNQSESLQGDEVTSQIKFLYREIEAVQKNVIQWQSSGRLKRALLSSGFAEELKGDQDRVQAVLAETHILLNFNTADLVAKLNRTIQHAERSRLLDRLGDGSYGREGNSANVVTCLPGTRVDILNKINRWIEERTASEPVFWVRGMAKCGKSTIASTIAENWKYKATCAIFHFRRGQKSTNGQFLCAIARQLGRSSLLEISDAILDCVRENEDITKEHLDQQFMTLFVKSIGGLQKNAQPILIVVDALDECGRLEDAIQFVNLIDQHSTSLRLNVKFLLTCRPEARLVAALETRRWQMENLDLSDDVSDDITQFIRDAFKKIREVPEVPNDWPSAEDVEHLAKMSQGSFQWAFTATSHVRGGSPIHRLRELLQHSSTWRGLDDTFHEVFSRAFGEARKSSMRQGLLSSVLGTLVAVAPEAVSLEVLAFMHADHEIFKGQEDIAHFLRTDLLVDLNSLLHVPDSPSKPLRFMHTSILDFLISSERCGHRPYFIDLIQELRRLAERSFQVMDTDLRQNICKLPDDAKANFEIQEEVKTRLSPGLQHCCRFWAIHLMTGVARSESKPETHPEDQVLAKFKVFSEKKLMYWLEVMSLIGATAEALTMAKQVHQWLLQWPRGVLDDTLTTLWNDTWRFIARFHGKIAFSALDIYASALPHCPTETRLWELYGCRATTQIPSSEVQPKWSANIWTSLAQSPVHAIAFCPDGSLIASGSDDKTIRFWDAQSGAPRGDSLNGHKRSVSSVAFSPDGKILASGSDDGAILLWDTQTRRLLRNGAAAHRRSVTSVAFSSDGRVLLSTSADREIGFWNAMTGSPEGDSVNGLNYWDGPVVLSLDGKVLAFASSNNEVRLWDVQKHALSGNHLTGHTEFITCIAISANSQILASASADLTIRLWNAQTGSPMGGPLTGHTEWVELIVFSPDGKILASASADHEIRLWDVQTCALLSEPLTGHTEWITSLAFSPDGKVLASASYDKAIMLWDAQTGTHRDGLRV